MEAAMTRPSMPLAITDEELQAEDPERLAYNDQVAALREAEYPMLKGNVVFSLSTLSPMRSPHFSPPPLNHTHKVLF